MSQFDCHQLNIDLQNSYDRVFRARFPSLQWAKNAIKEFFYRRTSRYQNAANPNAPKILFFCPWFDNFTHFTLEGFTRLYFALKNLGYLEAGDSKIGDSGRRGEDSKIRRKDSQRERRDLRKKGDFFVVVPPKMREFNTRALYESFIDPVLNAAGIDEGRRIYANTYSKLTSPAFITLKNAYLPTQIKCSPTKTNEAIDFLKAAYFDPNFAWSFERIYVSRKKANRRKIHNENEVVAFLAKHGFATLCMEDLSFKERVNILARTKILLGIDGTNLTSMIFMPPKSTVIPLRCYDMQEFNLFTAALRDIEILPIVFDVHKKVPDFRGDAWFFSDLVVDIARLETKLKEYGVL